VIDGGFVYRAVNDWYVKVVIEKSKTGYAAYSPDYDGGVATGDTREETIVNLLKALEFHIEGLEMQHLEKKWSKS